MDACPLISSYLMTKLLQHFLLSLCSCTLSLVIERCQVHNRFVCNGAKGIFTPLITMFNPLLNVGVITFLCSLPPSWHDDVYRVFANASVLQGFPDKEHAISFIFGRRGCCTSDIRLDTIINVHPTCSCSETNWRSLFFLHPHPRYATLFFFWLRESWDFPDVVAVDRSDMGSSSRVCTPFFALLRHG